MIEHLRLDSFGGNLTWLRVVPADEFPHILESFSPFIDALDDQPAVVDLQDLNLPVYAIHPMHPEGVKVLLMFLLDEGKSWKGAPGKDFSRWSAYVGSTRPGGVYFSYDAVGRQNRNSRRKDAPRLFAFAEWLHTKLLKEAKRRGSMITGMISWSDPQKLVISLVVHDVGSVIPTAGNFFKQVAAMLR